MEHRSTDTLRILQRSNRPSGSPIRPIRGVDMMHVRDGWITEAHGDAKRGGDVASAVRDATSEHTS